MQFLADKVVDRTDPVYGAFTPAHVRDGKTAVLAALAPQAEQVKGVQFLENFGLSPTESAVDGAARYTGVVVSLTPDYQLSDADAVWFNGPYSETLSLYPVEGAGEFTQLTADLMHPDDSHAASGIYERNEQDVFTGTQTTTRFCAVNASAGDLSRNLMRQWTADKSSVRDAYEKAATEELVSTGSEYDNMRHYISHVSQQMGAAMGAAVDNAVHSQVTNTFVRGAHGVVHYLNGAAVPVSDAGVLCHVSPLHGFVRLPREHDRTFYPAALLSATDYVDVAQLDAAQRGSIFTRALWPGCAETTVNPYALRRPVAGWQQSALPRPTEVYRMHRANFALDPRSCAALPPAAVLSMTPGKAHTVTGLKMPTHVQENKVRLNPHDGLIAQLVGMRESFPILNPSYFSQHPTTKEWQLTLPRDIASQLH
jgi:hypothetical protein